MAGCRLFKNRCLKNTIFIYWYKNNNIYILNMCVAMGAAQISYPPGPPESRDHQTTGKLLQILN